MKKNLPLILLGALLSLSALGATTTDQVLNTSGVTGSTATDAFNTLKNWPAPKFETTNYIIDPVADQRQLIVGNASSPITFTLPATAPVSTTVYVMQYGTGSVIFSSASGLLRNVYNFSSVGGQYNIVTLYVVANSGGSAAEWVLVGAVS